MKGGVKKVLHVTTVHRAPDPRIFLKECATLHNSDFDIEVLMCLPDATATLNGFRLRSIGAPTRSRIRRLTYQPRILASILAQRPVIVHFHDPELLPLMLFLALLMKRTTRFIYDMHEDYDASLGSSFLTLPARLLYKLFMRLSEHLMSFVLAEESYQALCRRQHVVVRNFPMEPLAPLQETRQNQIVYVGTVSIKRGIFEMIEAFVKSGLEDWKLVIIGGIDEEGIASEIYKQIAKHNADDRIEILGYMSADEAMRLVNRSKVGLAIIHPEKNYLHSLPTKVFEYLVHGVSVVISDFPFYREFFAKVPGIHFVNPLDTDRIAEVLRAVVSQPLICAEDIAFCLQRFSWEREGAKLVALYHSILPPENGTS